MRYSTVTLTLVGVATAAPLAQPAQWNNWSVNKYENEYKNYVNKMMSGLKQYQGKGMNFGSLMKGSSKGSNSGLAGLSSLFGGQSGASCMLINNEARAMILTPFSLIL